MEAAVNESNTWVPGLQVGAYTLLREIARGGMGEIWLAHQQGPAQFERLVVVKRVIAKEEDEQAFVTLFLDEARIASHLHHPNVVQVFELGKYGHSYYLAMEYLAGQPLGRAARRLQVQGGVVPAYLAVELIDGAARGLGYAHRRRGLDGAPLQIVHRDVSPQNLFITYEGQVKVLDFGIAKASGRLTHTRTGTVRGKLAYMAPEHAMGEPVTAASDVFSLGVVLFELVTGTRLWGGKEDVAILHALSEGAPLPRASTRNPAVDAHLDALVAKALAMTPRDRYVDGEAFHQALDAYLRSRASRGEGAEAAMQRAFAVEIAGLPAFQQTVLEGARTEKTMERDPEKGTPSSSSVSLPDRELPPRRQGMGLGALAALGSALVLVGSGGTVLAMRALAPAPPAPVVVAAPPRPAPTPVAVVVPAPKPVPPPEPVVPVDAGSAAVDEVVDAGVVAPVAAPSSDAGPAPAAVARPVAAAARGALSIDTDPWTRVMEGKRVLGETPLLDLPLPAGVHRLRLVNETDHVDTVVEVIIEPNRTTVKKLSF